MAKLIRTFEIVVETEHVVSDSQPSDQAVMDEIQSALESAWPYAVTVHTVKVVTATVAKRPNGYLPARHPQSSHNAGGKRDA